jgi:type IV pilus assembly protein PilA
MFPSLKRGFTLIELLLVIGIIAILAAIVIVAINPTKQLGDARDAQRRSDVNTILNAIYQYSIDSNGNLPSTITTVATETCRTGATCGTTIDLSVLTSNGKYLVSMPVDPKSEDPGTGYTVKKDANGRITVNATEVENAGTISVTR